jgi:hypothetical protein
MFAPAESQYWFSQTDIGPMLAALNNTTPARMHDRGRRQRSGFLISSTPIEIHRTHDIGGEGQRKSSRKTTCGVVERNNAKSALKDNM